MGNNKQLDEWEVKVLLGMTTDKIMSLADAIANTDHKPSAKLFEETMDVHIEVRRKLRTLLNDVR